MSDTTTTPAAEGTALPEKTASLKVMVPSSYDGYATKWQEYAGSKEESAFKREVYFLTRLISDNAKLQQASPVSLVEVLMNSAQFGLSLNPELKLCYVIPYMLDGKGMQAKLSVSYMGMAKMLVDAGAIKEIQAECIYAGDEAVIDMSAERKVVKHAPYWQLGTEKGDMRAAYTTAYMPDGRISQYVLPHDEIEAIMKTSEGFRAAERGNRKNSVWHLHFSEQAKKTCLRRHFKLLPKSAGSAMDRLSKVIELEDKDYQVQNSERPQRAAQSLVWAPAKMRAAKASLMVGDTTIDDMLDAVPMLDAEQAEELREYSRINVAKVHG